MQQPRMADGRETERRFEPRPNPHRHKCNEETHWNSAEQNDSYLPHPRVIVDKPPRQVIREAARLSRLTTARWIRNGPYLPQPASAKIRQ